jgi:hypothetical protein
MPDLSDGESTEMQGSGSKPYVLKNVGGVYSCSCPAWRNQSIAIEKRSCKHLRKLRGDEAEQARVGNTIAVPAKEAGKKAQAPPLLLAESWDGERNLAGWWMSEKLDGVRAFWTGNGIFLSRLGNPLHAPDWFCQGLPKEPLDGEFWIGRKKFQRTVGIVRRQDKTDLWKEVRFRVFDAPEDVPRRGGRQEARRSVDLGKDRQRLRGSLLALQVIGSFSLTRSFSALALDERVFFCRKEKEECSTYPKQSCATATAFSGVS